jgi:hypothetical protein
MRAFLLRLLLLAGIGVNVSFLLINLRPERPHLGGRQRVRLLLRAGPARVQWVKDNLLSEFGAAHDVDFEVQGLKSFGEVAEALRAEKDKPTGIALADISDELSDGLREGGALRPMQDVAPPEDVAAAVAEYVPEAVERATFDKKLWFVPKRALIDVAIYLRPAVEDLFLHWEQDRPAIEAALKEANGVGLPRKYELEKTPNAWDTYDLFVAGWYWAHHPAPWSDDAAPAPRLAIRTGLNEDALDDLLSALFGSGLTEAQVGQLDAQPVLDVLQWQALFRKHHLFAKECEDPKGVDGFVTNGLFKARKIAWAPIDQADSLWVHGGSRRDAEPGMASAAQIDWATLPEAASLELLRGAPARAGKSFSLEEVHFWALPVHSPRPQLAWELARFLTQRGLHQRETEAQGLLPIRRDLAEEYPILFRLDWMQRMLDASYRQAQRGTGDMPDRIAAEHLDKRYTELREFVLTRTPIPVTSQAVRSAVLAFSQASGKEAAHGQ